MSKTVIIRVIGVMGVIGLMTSCATAYKLDKTVWYNTSLVEKDGTNAMITTSLYFLSSDNVDIYSSVRVDSTMVVVPFKYATGTYSTFGNPKKEANIKIKAKTIDEKNITYKGAYHKSEAMYLVSPDSVTKIYGKLKKITLP